jgi:hypothetical protein
MALDQAPGELAHTELTDDLAILEPAAPKRTEISAATEKVEKKVIDYYRKSLRAIATGAATSTCISVSTTGV